MSLLIGVRCFLAGLATPISLTFSLLTLFHVIFFLKRVRYRSLLNLASCVSALVLNPCLLTTPRRVLESSGCLLTALQIL